MEGSGETRSSFGTSSSSYHEHHKQLDIPNLNMSPFGTTMCQSSHNASPENNIKTPGIPPSPPNFPPSLPYLQIAMSQPASQQPISQNLGLGSLHSRSLSQPTFYSMNCLPPLSPFPHCEPSPTSDALTASLLRGNSFRSCENLPPCKGHRRSNSDIPLGFSAMIQSSPQLMPISGQGASGRLVPAIDNLVRDKPVQSVKQELNLDGNAEGIGERKSEREVADELLVTFMNLDNIDPLHSSCTEDKDMDSRASRTKPHGGEISDNEVESSTKGNPNCMRGSGFSFPTEKKEGVKRSAGGDIAPTALHFRSVSMDSFMGNLNPADESPKLPPSLGTRVGQHSPSNAMDGNSLKFSLEFGNGEFSVAELKKIMANEKLAEIALSDPKRVKRILANRQSAALSKERKVLYISELEHKVQTLQTEATTLSAQLTYLQRESAGLSSQNHELKFRLQAMEQQAQLRDALNEALTAEVQRLKLATAELRGEVRPANNMAQQNSMNLQMFSMQN